MSTPDTSHTLATLPRLLLDDQAVAAMLAITPEGVQRLHQVGLLRGVLVSRRCLRWRPADVAAYVESLAPEGTP